MPNQYTKAKEEGRDLPHGANQFTTGKREKHDQATRDKMRAEHAALALQSILNDKSSTKDQQIAAAKALLPYGKSTFSSVENIEQETSEPMSQEARLEYVRTLITSYPELISQLGLQFKPLELVADPQQEAKSA